MVESTVTLLQLWEELREIRESLHEQANSLNRITLQQQYLLRQILLKLEGRGD